MKELLEIINLSKSFKKDKKRINVLNNMNFSVSQGEFLTVVGPSGCGKSTLLSLIAGFENYDSGQIKLNGKVISKPEPSRIMVFQDFNQLFPWKTILDNVIFPLRINRKDITYKEQIEIGKKYLKMVKLEDYLNYYPHEISGGMTQRVVIARALAMKPEILLMDEPFGSLDSHIKSELHDIVKQIWRKTHATIIFITHDIDEAVVLSDRIVIMGRSPFSVKDIIINDLDKPIDKTSTDFMRIKKDIHEKIKE